MRVSTIVIVLAIIGAGLYFAWTRGYIGQAQKQVEQSFTTHFARGQELYQTEKYEDAIRELEKAIEVEPTNSEVPVALMRIGDCYKELRQYDKSIEHYERVVKEYPNFKMLGQVQQDIEKVRTLGHF